ncbi:MAG: aminoacyl-tRNA hydrolase [Deltaproteobacteria bacterium]|nr:aminoacyl-tRNA hydrolase [Deltaproteobacteria bacterium]
MIKIDDKISIPESKISFQGIRAQGSGGQNVNKVSSAVHLRFDIHESGLPGRVKDKLLSLNDQRISKNGILVIKAQNFRSREKNKEDALNRLQKILQSVLFSKKKRKKTKPKKSVVAKRLDKKIKHGRIKESRKKVEY